MRFITMDMELADRYLPSICQITILTWENGKLIDKYNTYINPDCEIEEFLFNRHHISNEMVKDSPYLQNIWHEIYNRLNYQYVFCHNANRIITQLMIRAEVDNLLFPTLIYGDTLSMCRRTWKNKKDYSLITMTEFLNITKVHNNSLFDAVSVAKIIYNILQKDQNYTMENLFKSMGYAGGCVILNQKYSYRAIKDKLSGKFYAKINLPNKNNEKEPKIFNISLGENGWNSI